MLVTHTLLHGHAHTCPPFKRLRPGLVLWIRDPVPNPAGGLYGDRDGAGAAEGEDPAPQCSTATHSSSVWNRHHALDQPLSISRAARVCCVLILEMQSVQKRMKRCLMLVYKTC